VAIDTPARRATSWIVGRSLTPPRYRRCSSVDFRVSRASFQQQVPGVTFGVFADAQGRMVGVASAG